jgi:hypothetical protein
MLKNLYIIKFTHILYKHTTQRYNKIITFKKNIIFKIQKL